MGRAEKVVLGTATLILFVALTSGLAALIHTYELTREPWFWRAVAALVGVSIGAWLQHWADRFDRRSLTPRE